MISLLFVCLGNICRSCTAQTVMQSIVDRNGMSESFNIDSAGIINYHEGEMADSRMRKHAAQRGYSITHKSRPITPLDFERFDYIIGMDDSNIESLNRIATSNTERLKIHRMTEWCQNHETDVVPDPYYGGAKGFENVLDLLEDACQGLFYTLVNNQQV